MGAPEEGRGRSQQRFAALHQALHHGLAVVSGVAAGQRCGSVPRDPDCQSTEVGPPGGQFPLSSDPNPDPNSGGLGVDRDQNGWLGLGSTHAQFDFIYTANTDDWGRGTVSKLNSKTVREVARYADACNLFTHLTVEI